jgi:hypothetical protein
MKLSVAGFDLTVYRRPAGNDPMLVGLFFVRPNAPILWN